MRTKYFKFLAYFAFLASLIYGFYHILKAFDFVKEAYIYTGVFALFFLICRRKNKMSQKKNKMSYFCDKLSFFQP